MNRDRVQADEVLAGEVERGRLAGKEECALLEERAVEIAERKQCRLGR